MSKEVLLANVLEMSVDERIAFINRIWESIEEAADSDELTDEQRAELEDRYQDYLANPDAGSDWQEAKARILGARK